MKKDVTLSSVKALRKQLDDSIMSLMDHKTVMTGLTNGRDDSSAQGAELVTRIRSAMRGFYGPNSTQYEQVGGTRRDDRKKPTRKNANAASLIKAA